jgi:hypothetical protein
MTALHPDPWKVQRAGRPEPQNAHPQAFLKQLLLVGAG